MTAATPVILNLRLSVMGSSERTQVLQYGGYDATTIGAAIVSLSDHLLKRGWHVDPVEANFFYAAANTLEITTTVLLPNVAPEDMVAAVDAIVLQDH